MPSGGDVRAGRRRSRREALFILYQQDLLGLDAAAALARAERTGLEVAPYTRRLVLGVEAHRNDVDALLEDNLERWTLGRLGPVERNVLRLAAFELTQVEDVSPAVAINEAVELAKRYGSNEAAGLVNGVLGAIAG